MQLAVSVMVAQELENTFWEGRSLLFFVRGSLNLLCSVCLFVGLREVVRAKHMFGVDTTTNELQ